MKIILLIGMCCLVLLSGCADKLIDMEYCHKIIDPIIAMNYDSGCLDGCQKTYNYIHSRGYLNGTIYEHNILDCYGLCWGLI